MFEQLLALPRAEKEARGILFTPAEIAQQPATWAKAVDTLRSRREEIATYLESAGLTGAREANLILTGAGTSEFIGTAVANILRIGLGREVMSVPTTHLVTHSAHTLVPGHDYVVLNFARSGNSPESLATYDIVKRVPGTRQMVITCNGGGALAAAAQGDKEALCIELPEETNDQSLVMTSSFSTMAFTATGLCFLDSLDALAELARQLGRAADRIMTDYGSLLHRFAELPFARACFLGANTLVGTMQECHLKMQEMTEGRIACRFDSFLGLRHGPQVFVNDDCVVVASLSSDGHARRYEMDLLHELKAKKQGRAVLILCDRATTGMREITGNIVELFPDGNAVADAYRVMTDVVAGQILGLFTSLRLGLKPDNPSTDGTINRVVQGVKIYEQT